MHGMWTQKRHHTMARYTLILILSALHEVLLNQCTKKYEDRYQNEDERNENKFSDINERHKLRRSVEILG